MEDAAEEQSLFLSPPQPQPSARSAPLSTSDHLRSRRRQKAFLKQRSHHKRVPLSCCQPAAMFFTNFTNRTLSVSWACFFPPSSSSSSFLLLFLLPVLRSAEHFFTTVLGRHYARGEGDVTMRCGETSDTEKAITHFHPVPALLLRQHRCSKVKISLLDALQQRGRGHFQAGAWSHRSHPQALASSFILGS